MYTIIQMYYFLLSTLGIGIYFILFQRINPQQTIL